MPIGPNSGAPPRSIRTVNVQPSPVEATFIDSLYRVPPTPSPLISRADGGSNLRTVHVTRLRIPLAPATPTTVVPTSSSSGSSERHPWCMVIQSPSVSRLDACCQACCAGIGRDRDNSSFAMT